MAIEAMHQIIHDRKTPENVVRYIFKDAAFSKPPIISESSDRVEVQLRFRSSHTAAEGSQRPMKYFQVSSMSHDET